MYTIIVSASSKSENIPQDSSMHHSEKIVTTSVKVVKNVILYAICETVLELFEDYIESTMSGKE